MSDGDQPKEPGRGKVAREAAKLGASAAAGGSLVWLYDLPEWAITPLERLGSELTIGALSFAVIAIALYFDRRADRRDKRAEDADQTNAIVEVSIATTKQSEALAQNTEAVREMAHSVDRFGDNVELLAERVALVQRQLEGTGRHSNGPA